MSKEQRRQRQRQRPTLHPLLEVNENKSLSLAWLYQLWQGLKHHAANWQLPQGAAPSAKSLNSHQLLPLSVKLGSEAPPPRRPGPRSAEMWDVGRGVLRVKL